MNGLSSARARQAAPAGDANLGWWLPSWGAGPQEVPRGEELSMEDHAADPTEERPW